MARPQEHSADAILAAAQTLFCDEGVAVSTARIAQAAGVSNGTLFNYLPTKQALIDALYLSIKTDLAEAIGTIPADGPIQLDDRQADVAFDVLWNGISRQAKETHD